MAMLATLAIAAPAFHAVAAALGRPWPMRSVVALTLAAAGRASLPLARLRASSSGCCIGLLGVSYRVAAVLAAIAYGASGLAALGILIRGLGKGSGRGLTTLAFIAIFFAVGGQTSWILRPYLVRPRTEHAPFTPAPREEQLQRGALLEHALGRRRL